MMAQYVIFGRNYRLIKLLRKAPPSINPGTGSYHAENKGGKQSNLIAHPPAKPSAEDTESYGKKRLHISVSRINKLK